MFSIFCWLLTRNLLFICCIMGPRKRTEMATVIPGNRKPIQRLTLVSLVRDDWYLLTEQSFGYDWSFTTHGCLKILPVLSFTQCFNHTFSDNFSKWKFWLITVSLSTWTTMSERAIAWRSWGPLTLGLNSRTRLELSQHARTWWGATRRVQGYLLIAGSWGVCVSVRRDRETNIDEWN